MHFYDFNVGDYAKKTQHLTNEEDLAYRRALDMYYDTEKPLESGGLATLSRRLRVNEQALKNILDEFFPNGKNKHADEKIEAWNKRGWFPSETESLRQPIDEWKITRLRIFERDKFTCSYCGSVGGELECDHVIPISRNGTSEDSNLTTSCKPCNRLKSNMMPDEFIAQVSA